MSARPRVLTRWSIIVRDWLGSDSLRGMTAESEALVVRLYLDQWEHGAARDSKAHWQGAHGHRFADFDRAWNEATALFEVTPAGLVNARVAADRTRCLGEIEAKCRGANKTNAARAASARGVRGAERTNSVRPSDAERASSVRSASAERPLSGTSASASESASASASDSASASPRTETRARACAADEPRADTTLNATAGEVAPRRRTSRGAATSAHRRFSEGWGALFLAAKGTPYAFDGGKDGRHVRDILEFTSGDVELALTRARTLLESRDPYFARTGIDLGTLRSQWNRIASAKDAPAVGPRSTQLPDGTKPGEYPEPVKRMPRIARG